MKARRVADSYDKVNPANNCKALNLLGDHVSTVVAPQKVAAERTRVIASEVGRERLCV